MLYIVYIAIDDEIADEWQEWMAQVHVPDVVNTGAFDVGFLARDTSRDRDARRAYRVIYKARDASALAEYQRDHAPALQAEHTLLYEGRFEASRDILEVVSTTIPSSTTT